MNKILKNVFIGATMVAMWASATGGNFAYAADVTDSATIRELWKDYGNTISPIQVQIGSDFDGSRYMLPTYATPANILYRGWGCSPNYEAFANKPEGAIRYNCNSVADLKALLKSLKISNFHTTYGSDLPDLYIPKYYVMEQDVIVENPSFINIRGGKIYYEAPAGWNDDLFGGGGWTDSGWKAIFGIYDPDSGNRWAAKSLEGSVYYHTDNVPNLGIEVFQLDGSRLSTDSLRAGVYTIEHYLTPMDQKSTYDSNEVFWTNDSLKYALNQYTSKMEEKVFRDVCNQPKSGVSLYKNDDYNYAGGLQLRTFLKNPNGTRLDSVNGGDCASVNGLLASRNGMINGSVNDHIVGVDEQKRTIAEWRAYIANENLGSFAGRKILGLHRDMGNDTILNIGVDKNGIIGDVSHFANQDYNFIKQYYVGKTVKLYYLIKLTSHYDYSPVNAKDKSENARQQRNKYFAGLDPLNPDFYDKSVNQPLSAANNKYLYGWDSFAGSDSGNAYVLLGAAFESSLTPSSIYELSAPGYAQKADKIGGSPNARAVENRIKNMHLNISQGYQETEAINGKTKTDDTPHLYLMSPTRIIAPAGGINPNVITRNYDADMEIVPSTFGETKNKGPNMEQNLDYIMAYKGNDTSFKEPRNSAKGDGIIAIGQDEAFWAGNFNNVPLPQSDCSVVGVQNSLFPSIYSLNPSCGQWGVLYQKGTMSSNSSNYTKSGNQKFYQQFQVVITKNNPSDMDKVNKGTLLQTIANMGDTEVYNQIYLNTNFMVGLPNKEDMECEINLHKMPTVASFDYKSKIDSDADLSADETYKTDANPFMPTTGTFVDKTIVDHVLKNRENQSAYDEYYASHYGDTSYGNRQKWLVGEKGILTYSCKKNTTAMDEVVIEVKTSDEKFTYDNGTKWFTRLPDTDKLTTPLLTFNTGSHLAYQRWGGQFNDLALAPNSKPFIGPIKDTTKGGFIERTLGSPDNKDVNQDDVYLGRKSRQPGLFNGGIEVGVPNGTGKDKYGKVEVIIYDKNRPGAVLDSKTYYITTNKVGDTPGNPPVDDTPPNGYCNVIEQIVPFGGKGGDRGVCDPNGGGEVKDDIITLEEGFIWGNSVTYKLVCGNTGGQEFKGKLNFNISGLYSYAESDEEGNVQYSVSVPWGNSALVKNGGFTVTDFTIPGKTQGEIIVTIPLKQREPRCPDSPMKASASLSSKVQQDGLPSTTNTVEMLECKLPTLKFKGAFAKDGNTGNDRAPGNWSSAYPFEFNQCNNRITYEVEAEYLCFDKDPTAKDLEVFFYGGNVTDGLNQNRDPFAERNWHAAGIFGVQAQKTGKNAHWDLSQSTQSFAGRNASGFFRANVSVTAPEAGHMRIADNRFVIKKIGDTQLRLQGGGNISCNNRECFSGNLTTDIGLDPVVESEKMYDKGILEDTNPMHSYLHREEIDGKSKKLTKDGAPHYEPVRYQTTVSNPSVNRDVYGLNEMNFDMRLNSSNSSYFEKIAPENAEYQHTHGVTVVKGDIEWSSLRLPAGSRITTEGAFNVFSNLRTPNHTPSNASEKTRGHTSMDFSQDSNMMCSYTQGFSDWESGIKKNPITIDALMIEEVSPNSKMPDPKNPRLEIEQHLPDDTMKIVLDISNNNPTRTFDDTFIRINFDRTGSGIIDEEDKNLDLTKLFVLEGNDEDGWKVSPNGDIKCKIEPDNLLCQMREPLQPNTQVNTSIFLKINIESEFYKKLKSVAPEKEWKFWYPVVINKVTYGSPDLNLVNDIVYYTADEQTNPSGGDIDDVGEMHLDFNIPENREVKESPYDSNFAFYVGIPYATIENSFVNASIGNFSPGDIGYFTTTVKNIGKASIKNPEIIQDLYHLGIQNDWVDTEVRKITVTPSVRGTSIPAAKTTDFYAINNDTDDTNDVNTSGLPYVYIKGSPVANVDYNIVAADKLEYYPTIRPFLIHGSQDLNSGGSLEARTDIKFIKLKQDKYPQIDCKTADDCQRAGKNPKSEEFRAQLDIPNIGDQVDEEDIAEYKVHFPILKSILFAKTNTDFRPADGSNTNIQWKLNSGDTTVTYRVDNFVPQEYTQHDIEKVGKARNPVAYIRLPVGVTYVPGSLKVVNNIQDGTIDPTYNTVANAGFEPTINDVTDYKVEVAGNSSFDNTFLTNNEWHKVTGTNAREYALMKGTPFVLNYFGEAYNFYRITNEGALVLGRKTNNANILESDYYNHKKENIIAAISPITIHFGTTYNEISASQEITYLNDKGVMTVAAPNTQLSIGANTEVNFPANTVINLYEGMEGMTIKGDYTVTNLVEISRTGFEKYPIIAPLFEKIDTSRKNEHGVYEKVERDANGKVVAVKYQWFGYVAGTNYEVKFGVTLNSSNKHNSITLTYGDIDPNLANKDVISGISKGDGMPNSTHYSDYSIIKLGSLGNKPDISYLLDSDTVYQEISLPVGYTPDALDVVRAPVLHPQEKDTNGMFVKGPGKDQTATIYQFNVKIGTNDLVCGSEFVTSDGGNTLRWKKLTSNRSDREDIDMFCFSAKKPTIKILDNASYARGGYKTSNNNCTVNHLSLMGFNSKSVGWNSNTNNGCWLTYNIQKYEKDLSIYTTSPYDLLGGFKDKTDARPIDNTLITSSQHVTTSPVGTFAFAFKDGKTLANDLGNVAFKGFQGNKFMLVKNYVEGGTSDEYSTVFIKQAGVNEWQEVKTFEKLAEKAFISDTIVLVVFTDGTYTINKTGGVGTWDTKSLADYSGGVNAIHFSTNSKWFIIGKKGIVWTTEDTGDTFIKRNFSQEYALNASEEINNIDSHGGKEVWMVTSNGNVLYSKDTGNVFEKKTTGVALDKKLWTFDDGSILLEDSTNLPTRLRTNTNIAGIDTVDNRESIKFDNLGIYERVSPHGGNSNYIKGVNLAESSADKRYFSIDNDAPVYNLSAILDARTQSLRGNLKIDMILMNAEKYDIDYIKLTGNNGYIEIYEPAQFTVPRKFEEGLNTIAINFTDKEQSGKYKQHGAVNGALRLEVYGKTARKSLANSSGVIGKVSVQPHAARTETAVLPAGSNTFGKHSSYSITARNNTIAGLVKSTEAPGNELDLSTFMNDRGVLEGNLVFNFYLKTPLTAPDREIISMKFENAQGSMLTLKNIALLAEGGMGEFTTPGWKTISVPLKTINQDSSVINYKLANFNGVFTSITIDNVGINKYMYYAIDNFTFAANANVSLVDVKYFNSLEGVLFGLDKNTNKVVRYNTFDNKTWSLMEVYNTSNVSELSNLVKMKGRELYGFLGRNISFFTLDKGFNFKTTTSGNRNPIKMITEVNGEIYTINGQNTIEKITLVND